MARSHLTLAALATSAVPGLEVGQARIHSYGAQGDFDSALLVPQHGVPLIIRVPTNQAAESEQGADVVALRAITEGVRSRLPFAVPKVVGQAPVGSTRGVVFEFLEGDKVETGSIDAVLAAELGRAVAAIHSLPTAFVGEAGLPALTASDSHSQVRALVERAVATRRVPAALHDRWREAVADPGLWQFQPTVVNGGLGADSFLLRGDSVVGVLNWAGLRVDDPARDLHWTRGLREEAGEAALAAYAEARGLADDVLLELRATLYAELEVARWLLHGHELHDETIVHDAVRMMDNLVDHVHSDTAEPLSPDTGPVLAVGDVEAMLGGPSEGGRPPGLAPVPAEDETGAADGRDMDGDAGEDGSGR